MLKRKYKWNNVNFSTVNQSGKLKQKGFVFKFMCIDWVFSVTAYFWNRVKDFVNYLDIIGTTY